jgi:Glycosyl hydrolase family 20, domain 2
MIRETRQLGLILVLFWCISAAQAATPSLLFARGYTVIPEPQKVELSGDDFVFGNGWRLVLDSGVSRNLGAVEILRDDLASRYGINLETASKSGSVSKTLRLTIP